MENEKYSNYPLSISAILGLIEANDIAIPEIPRDSAFTKCSFRKKTDICRCPTTTRVTTIL